MHGFVNSDAAIDAAILLHVGSCCLLKPHLSVNTAVTDEIEMPRLI